MSNAEDDLKYGYTFEKLIDHSCCHLLNYYVKGTHAKDMILALFYYSVPSMQKPNNDNDHP